MTQPLSGATARATSSPSVATQASSTTLRPPTRASLFRITRLRSPPRTSPDIRTSRVHRKTFSLQRISRICSRQRSRSRGVASMTAYNLWTTVSAEITRRATRTIITGLPTLQPQVTQAVIRPLPRCAHKANLSRSLLARSNRSHSSSSNRCQTMKRRSVAATAC